jgi:hypothetical protein
LDVWIRMIEFAMSVFNCVGDGWRAAGVAMATSGEGDKLIADLEAWLESHRGRTIEGTTVVGLPPASAARL